MAKVPITVKVNGVEHSSEVEPRMLLVHFIRDVLRLTGTHIGCDTSHCGACTVVMDGHAIKSCTAFAVQADGRELMTVEGLEQDGKLHPLQDGFFQEHGCGCNHAMTRLGTTDTSFDYQIRLNMRTTWIRDFIWTVWYEYAFYKFVPVTRFLVG